MSNAIFNLDEQALETVCGGRISASSFVYAPNNSKVNNSTITLSSFGMNSFGNFATNGGAIGNLSISVQQLNG